MDITQPILGGILIGFAAFSLHILLGRVAGISGIVGRLLPPRQVSRISLRYLVATAVFIAAGAATVAAGGLL